MFYTVYKITNTINNKIYIGVHKTTNLYDEYMGSGELLKKAQTKYGIENFEKEILEVFDNQEDMFEMESKLVTEDFVKSQKTYNLKEGGYGGFDHLNNDERISKSRSKGGLKAAQIKALKRLDEDYDKKYREICSMGGSVAFKGKTHSEDSKKKMSQTKKDMNFQKGESNSQFGSMWIHNLEMKESKKIKKDDFSDWEAKGWLKGRKMKF